MRFTKLEDFQKFLKQSTDADINRFGKELESQLPRVRNPQRILGHKLMIDECLIQLRLRKMPPCEMSIDEIYNGLAIQALEAVNEAQQIEA